MSLESRPYIGTWKLNGTELVQHTPDALIYINGDTSLPGCSKCSGKIDLQKFVTECSVDAGTEPGSASASFTLSIPLHHSESFARDAKFLLRPGLEVHIYMRGYFPVRGLYSHLAEARSKNRLTGGSTESEAKASDDVPDPPVEVDPKAPVSTDYQDAPEKVKLKMGKHKRTNRPTIIIIHESGSSNLERTEGTLLKKGASVHYLVNGNGVFQYADPVTDVTYHTPGGFNQQSVGIEFNHAYFGSKGEVIPAPWFHKKKYTIPGAGKLERLWRTVNHVSNKTGIPVNFTNVSGGSYKFGGSVSGKSKGVSSHRSAKGNHSDGTFPMLYCAVRQRGYSPAAAFAKSVEMAKAATSRSASVPLPPKIGSGVPGGQSINSSRAELEREIKWSRLSDKMKIRLAKKLKLKLKKPVPKVPDHKETEGLKNATGTGLEPGHHEGDGHDHGVGDEDATTGDFGPSVLEEMGLDGIGLEKTLAYPYYHVFHGVVTEVSHSYSGGVNTVSVNCSSMLHFWQYQNMSTNASVFGARPTNSKLKMSMVGHNFTGMHPYSIMYTLHHDMVGAAGGVGYALSSKSNQKAVSSVGGETLFSLNIRYWQKRFSGRTIRLRMHGATGELFSTMAAAWLGRTSSANLTLAMRQRYKVQKGGGNNRAKRILGEAESVGLFRSKAGRISLDATRAAARSGPRGLDNKPRFEVNLVEMQAFVSNIGNWGQINLFESSYESKLDVAQKVMSITGFEFYQDVDGDFVFKPPMWNLDTSTSRVYRIEDIDIINISFSEKEPQVTYMTVKGSQFKNIQGTGTENEWGVKGQYIDYRLVAQFGWRPGSYETAYFNDPKSMFFSAVNRMDVMNIGINSASLSIPERPELRPGFPVYIPYLDCFYYCNSFSHSHSVGGQCTTSLQLVAKRAKFYAPGQTLTDSRGIEAINLGNTLLPERPLGVIGNDGKPRLSGFPNVVMALDPTAINPLFFVVGTDIEKLTDPRVLKYLIQIGVDEFIIEKEDREDGKLVYLMPTSLKTPEGKDSEPLTVRFILNGPDDLKSTSTKGVEPGTSGSVVNLIGAALQHDLQMKRLIQKDETSAEESADLQEDINDAREHIVELGNSPNRHTDKVLKEIEKKRKLINGDGGLLDQQAKALAKREGKKLDAIAEWSADPGKNAGIGFLLEMVKLVGVAYNLNADYQGRADLDSTTSLLDLVSDKKAIFTNGQQPGEYRYYSASHPAREHQGPRVSDYVSEKVKKVVEGPALEIQGDVPTVRQYTFNPIAPFPGAKIPESGFINAKPEVGIRVLNSNPEYHLGQVISTSEVMEMMFSVQAVTAVKPYTTVGRGRVTKNFGKALTKAVQAWFVTTGGLHGGSTLDDVFGSAWDQARAVLTEAIRAAKASAASGAVTIGASAPLMPSVKIFGATVSPLEPFSGFKWKGNTTAGAVALTSGGAGKSIATFAKVGGLALGKKFADKVSSVRRSLLKQLQKSRLKGDTAGQDGILDEYNSAIGTGFTTPTNTGLKRHYKGTRQKVQRTFSPVFPVSDANGYTHIGTYRYGRSVDIDPEGVFAQMHKTDLFALLDKHLVEKILRIFVQGKSVPPVMITTEVNGKKITTPSSDKATIAKSINDEVVSQLRKRDLTDKQILDYGFLLKGGDPDQLQFSLANIFADTSKDGVQKIPVINAAYSLADLTQQQSGHICDCKAAEADVLISAFGQEQFVTFSQAGTPSHEGFGTDPSDQGTRFLAMTAGIAAASWEQQQSALRGQVLDRSRGNVVKQFVDTFGIDTPGVKRPGLVEQSNAALEAPLGNLNHAVDQFTVAAGNLDKKPEDDLTVQDLTPEERSNLTLEDEDQ